MRMPHYAMNSTAYPLLIIATFLISHPLNAATINLVAAPNVSVHGQPRAIIAGDFSGDGIVDYAIVNNFDNTILIGNGTGGGGFSDAIREFATGSAPVFAAVADFNGDGRLDFAVANSGSNDVSIILSSGASGFSNAVNYAVGTQPVSITTGEFNGDGRVDLAVANNISGTVTILINSGGGTFTAGPTLSAGTQPCSVVAADLNVDGIMDLAVADSSGNRILIFTGNGNGTFAMGASLTVGQAPVIVLAADFTGNGKADLAVANSGSNSVTLLRNDGSGGFSNTTDYGVAANPTWLAVGDLNNDGYKDLVAGSGTTSTLSILVNNTTGGFNAAANQATPDANGTFVLCDINNNSVLDILFTSSSRGFVWSTNGNGTGGFNPGWGGFTPTGQLRALAIADFNGDGIADLCVACNSAGGRHIRLYAGDNNGNFTQFARLAGTGYATAVKASDVNNDGRPDIIVTSQFFNTVNVFLNNGNGNFSAPLNIPAGSNPISLGIGDFNRDGNLDLAIGHYPGTTVNIMLGNGTGNFSAGPTLAAGSSQYGIGAGDFNGDGNLDVVSSNLAADLIYASLGNGDGTFSSSANYTTGDGPARIATGDFNKDGYSDIAVACEGGFNSIFLGSSSGTLILAATIAVPNNPSAIRAVDLDGDGNLDLLCSGAPAKRLMGNGDGTFGSPISLGYNATSDVFASDFNADGRPDVALIDGFNNRVSILLNSPAVDISLGTPSAALTRNGPVSFSVNYNYASSITLSAANVTLNATGTATATVSVSGSGLSSRTVTLSNISGNGTLGISLSANTASNSTSQAPGAGPSATLTVDNTPPGISISVPSTDLTRSGPVTFDVAYSGANAISLSAGDVTLLKTGTADGTVSVSGTSTALRTVALSSISGDGTLGISVTAGSASDLAGNLAATAGPSATITVDNTPPSVSIGAPSAGLTRDGPVTFDVAYSGADSVSLAEGDVTLIKTGSADGTVSVSGTGTALRSVAISGISGDGTLAISIAAGSASDLAGNSSSAASPSQTFMVDNTPPTAVLNGVPTNPTFDAGINITVSGIDALVYRFKLDGAPYSPATGVGTPITVSNLLLGAHTLAVIAVDTAGNWQNSSGATAYAWTIHPFPPVITSATHTTAPVKSAFTYRITATNSPDYFDAQNLPAGLSINTATGEITGILSNVGISDVTLAAGNAGGTETAVLRINATPSGPPLITSMYSSMNPARIGTSVSFWVTATHPDGLPISFSWDFGDGAASAGPETAHIFTEPGHYKVIVEASDGYATASAALEMVVFAPASGASGSGVNAGASSTNPLQQISIAVLSSEGGVVELQVTVPALSEGQSVSTTISDGKSTLATVTGLTPVFSLLEPGLYVATASLLDSNGALVASTNILLPIGAAELGFTPALDISTTILKPSLMGMLFFTGSHTDFLKFRGIIEVGPEFDSQECLVGVGAMTDGGILNANGTLSESRNGLLKRLHLSYRRNSRFATISFILKASDMAEKWLIQNGIGPRLAPGESALKPARRSLSVAILLAGVSYRVEVRIDYQLLKNLGKIKTSK